MNDRDTRRWLRPTDPADARLAALLEAGRAELPSAERLRALAERLEPTFASPPSGSGGRGGASGAAGPALPWAPLAVGAALALLAGAFWSTRGTRHTPVDAPQAPRPGLSTSPSQPVAVSSHDAEPATVTSSPAAREAAVVKRPTHTSRSATTDHALTSATELALLEEAHRALSTDPRRALDAVTRHRRQFPRGQYEQEREVLAIEALVALRDTARASTRARAFLARHAESGHARRVRALLAAATSSLATDGGAGAR